MAGKPRRLVQRDIDGLHFHNLDELVAVTRAIPDAENEALRDAVQAAARSYSEETFTMRVSEIAARVGKVRTSASGPAPIATLRGNATRLSLAGS